MKTKNNYAWLIAGIAFLCMFMALGVCSTSFSSVSAYLYEYWGISNTVNATIVNCRTFASLITIALATPYYKKMTYRWGIAASIMIGGIGWLFFWAANGNVFMTYIGGVCLGICRGLAGIVPVAVLCNNWFIKHKAFVIGLCSAASGVCTSVMPKILKPFVATFGLQKYFLFIIVIYVIAAALVALFVRDTPEQLGMKPYGYGEEIAEKDKKQSKRPHDYSARPIDQVFLYIACFLIGGTCGVFGNSNTLALTSAGWAAADAAGVMFWYGIFNMVFKPVYGWAIDRFKPIYMILIGVICQAVGSYMLSCAGASYYGSMMAIMTFFIWAIGAPASSAGFGIYAIDLSTPDTYAKLTVRQTLLYNIGNMVLQQIAGIMADSTGNYKMVMYCLIVLNILVGGCFVLAYSGAHKNYMKLHAESKNA